MRLGWSTAILAALAGSVLAAPCRSSVEMQAEIGALHGRAGAANSMNLAGAHMFTEQTTGAQAHNHVKRDLEEEPKGKGKGGFFDNILSNAGKSFKNVLQIGGQAFKNIENKGGSVLKKYFGGKKGQPAQGATVGKSRRDLSQLADSSTLEANTPSTDTGSLLTNSIASGAKNGKRK